MDEKNNRSTLFVWGANYNGAMINEKGRTCLQAASYAKSKEVDFGLSAALLKILGQIDLSNNDDKLLAIKATEAITTLQENSKQSTYLSVGLFGICLLCANENLSVTYLTNGSMEKRIGNEIEFLRASITHGIDSRHTISQYMG